MSLSWIGFLSDVDRTRLFDHLTKTLGDVPAVRAMRRVPRERFVPGPLRHQAYQNIPLSIGHGQTISQPQMVAVAAEALQLQGDEYVLEVGAGSGYQAAVLAELLPLGSVVAVERIPELTDLARRNLSAGGYGNVTVVAAGSALGAPERAPFDAILVSASAPRVPESLLAQLKPGGRMALPVGVGEGKWQTLTRVWANPDGRVVEELGPCGYVPLIGEEAWPAEP